MPRKNKIVDTDDFKVDKIEPIDELETLEERPVRRVKKSDYREALVYDPATDEVKTILRPKQQRNYPDKEALKAKMMKAREVRMSNIAKRKADREAKRDIQQAAQPIQPTQPMQPIQPTQSPFDKDTIRDMIRSELMNHMPQKAARQPRQPKYDDEEDDELEVQQLPKPRQQRTRPNPHVELEKSNIEIPRKLIPQEQEYDPYIDAFGSY